MSQIAELTWLRGVFADVQIASAQLDDGFLGSAFEHYRAPVRHLAEMGLQTATPEMLWDSLGEAARAALSAIGHGTEYLAQLAGKPPTADETRYSAHQLRQRRVQEVVASGVQRLSGLLFTAPSSETLAAELFAISEEVQKITSGGDKEYLIGTEVADFALYQLGELHRKGGVMRSGIRQVDELLSGGGFRAGQFVAIGMWPAHGKSLFVSALAEGCARSTGTLAYFIDGEMGAATIVGRTVQRTTGRRLGSFPDFDAELAFLTPQLARVAGTPIVVGAPRRMTLQNVLRHSLMAVQLGCRIIVWDGITIIKNNLKGGTRQEEIETITREAKAFAREHDILLLGTGQLNQDRPPQQGLLRPPEREDFKGSRSFTEDADYCFLGRRVDKKPCSGDEELYGMPPDQMREKLRGTTWFKLAKDRHGDNENEIFSLRLDSQSLRYQEETLFN